MKKNDTLNDSEEFFDDESKKLSNELSELINFVPQDKKEAATKIISSLTIKAASSFSGPLPPPSVLREYNNVLEHGAERIMKMAEKQSSHRIELEKHAIKEELKQSRNGQIFGFILAIIWNGNSSCPGSFRSRHRCWNFRNDNHSRACYSFCYR
jgi:uncharacterized membrane protein